MTEFPPRLILANAFSRDSFGSQPVLIRLALGRAVGDPYFVRPLTYPDQIPV
jgi:hypothetical protein